MTESFGNTTADYSSSLAHYYANGAAEGWADLYVTPYASAHPLEDWAETWAHYLHLLDLLETAHSFGLSLSPRDDDRSSLAVVVDFDPYLQVAFDTLLHAGLAVSSALNGLSRGLGHTDPYPFVLRPWVIEKLRRIHDAVRTAGQLHQP